MWNDSNEGIDFWEEIDDKWYNSIKIICKLKGKRKMSKEKFNKKLLKELSKK